MDGYYGLLVTGPGPIDQKSTRAVICRRAELVGAIEKALQQDAVLIQLIARNATLEDARWAVTMETARMLAGRPPDTAGRERGSGEARAIVAIYERAERSRRFMCVGSDLTISTYHAFELLVRDGAKAIKIARGTSRARAIAAVLQFVGRPAV